jgi:type VI protein secretion system component Hcp
MHLASEERTRSRKPLLLFVLLVWTSAAQAASLYLQIPGIVGEQSTPGYPGAMQVQSIQITPKSFAVVKSIDSASPQIVHAVTVGTIFPNASALIYDSAPVGPPDSSFLFQNVLASSYQIQSGGMTEKDSFAASNPLSMFLEVPGIVGASSTPGHPFVMQITSFTLTANEFTITKALDSASPQLALAVANGTIFSTADILFYNATTPAGPPDGVFGFETLVASAYQPLDNNETVTFNFANVVPEPATPLLLTSAGLLLGAWRLFQNAKPKLK